MLWLGAGEDKPTGFKKMLANTCQEEYEATEEARKVRRQRPVARQAAGLAAPARGHGSHAAPWLRQRLRLLTQAPARDPLPLQRSSCYSPRSCLVPCGPPRLTPRVPPLPAPQELKSLPAEERPDAERRAKQRLLGNIRLIAELFNKAQVNDRIMLLILADLLGGADNDPPEDSVEVRGGQGGVAAGRLQG